MFACCCPQKAEQKRGGQLQEALIARERTSTEVVVVQKEGPKEAQEAVVKEMPVNKNIEKMAEFVPPPLHHASSLSSNKSELEDAPVMEQKTSSRSVLKMNNEEGERIKKKSQLWQQQPGTKILYFSHEKQEEMIFAFKIVSIRTAENNALSYTLNPLKHVSKIRIKPQEVSLNLVVWNKSISETKSALKNLESDAYSKNIFGAYRKQEDQKGAKVLYDSEDIHEIMVMGSNCIRLDVFDKIVISCLNEKDFSHILSFCQRIMECYELDDLSKVIFLFPAELTLQEINQVLSKLLRKHLISERLEQIIKFMGFHLERVEGDMVEPFIVVKSNLLMCEQEEIYSKEFQIKLELAIGLLMIEINYNNLKAYEKVLDSFFIDTTIISYLKAIQFIHKEKKDYLNKLEELKLFESNQLLEIQNSTRIEEKTINANEKCIVIKHRIKKRMGELFTDYRTAQTPIQESQKKKKEWDDDLRQDDIRVNVDKNLEQAQNDDNINLFENIDDSFVDNASLDIIAGLQFKEE